MTNELTCPYCGEEVAVADLVVVDHDNPSPVSIEWRGNTFTRVLCQGSGLAIAWRPKPGLPVWLCRIGIHFFCRRAMARLAR